MPCLRLISPLLGLRLIHLVVGLLADLATIKPHQANQSNQRPTSGSNNQAALIVIAKPIKPPKEGLIESMQALVRARAQRIGGV
jgi:hypothetical protein